MYKNQIPKELIDDVLTEEEQRTIKRFMKNFYELKHLKRDAELNVYHKISGRVIGILYDVILDYDEVKDEIYFQHDSGIKKKWYRKIPFLRNL